MVTTPRLTYQNYADLEGDERYKLLEGALVLHIPPNDQDADASRDVRLRGGG